MATPVGHTLAGYLVYRLMPPRLKQSSSRVGLWGAIAIANLPDLDFLPGLLTGDAFAFHRRGSHTLIAAVLAGCLVAIGLRLARRWVPKTLQLSPSQMSQCGVWATAIYLVHLGLDFVMADRIPPYGLQLLWPFTDAFLISPVALIPGFQFEPILSWRNLLVVGVEILWLVPMIGVAGTVRKAP
ncbi:MAG: metal-dependent hydrolase [Cyanobacteria bacterium J06607_6]